MKGPRGGRRRYRKTHRRSVVKILLKSRLCFISTMPGYSCGCLAGECARRKTFFFRNAMGHVLLALHPCRDLHLDVPRFPAPSRTSPPSLRERLRAQPPPRFDASPRSARARARIWLLAGTCTIRRMLKVLPSCLRDGFLGVWNPRVPPAFLVHGNHDPFSLGCVCSLARQRPCSGSCRTRCPCSSSEETLAIILCAQPRLSRETRTCRVFRRTECVRSSRGC